MAAFQEDFLQTIKNVGWGSAYVSISMVAQWDSKTSNFDIPFGLAPLPALVGRSTLKEIGPVITPKQAMPPILAKNNFWCYQPKKTTQSIVISYKVIDAGLYYILTNNGLIITDLLVPYVWAPDLAGAVYERRVPFKIYYTFAPPPSGGLLDPPIFNFFNGPLSPGETSNILFSHVNSSAVRAKVGAKSGREYLAAEIASHTDTEGATETTVKSHSFLKLSSLAHTGNNIVFSILTPGNLPDAQAGLEWTALVSLWTKPLFTLNQAYELVPRPKNELLSTVTHTISINNDFPEGSRRTTFTLSPGTRRGEWSVVSELI